METTVKSKGMRRRVAKAGCLAWFNNFFPDDIQDELSELEDAAHAAYFLMRFAQTGITIELKDDAEYPAKGVLKYTDWNETEQQQMWPPEQGGAASASSAAASSAAVSSTGSGDDMGTTNGFVPKRRLRRDRQYNLQPMPTR